MSKLRENLILILGLTISFIAGAFMVLKAPQYHSDYIRGKTQKSTLLMYNKNNAPIGTGFIVNHQGVKLVITNDHICDHMGGKGVGSYMDGDTEVKVILTKTYIKSSNDLCLLEVGDYHSLSGLSLSSGFKLGQEVMAVGHPSTMPFTLSRGQIIGVNEVIVPIAPVFTYQDKTQCLDKTGTATIHNGFMEVCVRISDAIYTNVLGLPGNSGSALVDFWGNVVGVVFAGNRAGWLLAAPVQDLKQLLSDYSESKLAAQ